MSKECRDRENGRKASDFKGATHKVGSEQRAAFRDQERISGSAG